jgi:hypothetical protein
MVCFLIQILIIFHFGMSNVGYWMNKWFDALATHMCHELYHYGFTSNDIYCQSYIMKLLNLKLEFEKDGSMEKMV